jgi:hypothetical protein
VECVFRPLLRGVLRKLSCTSRMRGSEEDTERPSQAVWIGLVVKVGPTGHIGGKNDYNDNMLPDFLITLVKPKELIFTELPASSSGSSSREVHASLCRQAHPGTVVAHIRDAATFSDGDSHRYLAEVIGVVSEKQYQVKIRYRVGNEILVVHSAQLTNPPAGTVPSG